MGRLLWTVEQTATKPKLSAAGLYFEICFFAVVIKFLISSLQPKFWELPEALEKITQPASIRAVALPDTQLCIRLLAKEAIKERPHLHFGLQLENPHEKRAAHTRGK